MKQTLKLTALVIAAIVPCFAFAEFIGAPLPVTLYAEAFLAAFVLVVGALIVSHDYSEVLRPLSVNSSYPTNANRSGPTRGIRRGSEAARLAA